jgi:hypothetical protein
MSNDREPVPSDGANEVEVKTFRITTTRADLDNFLHLLEYIPDLSAQESTVAASEADRKSFGQLDFISVLVEFSLAFGAHASWDVLKTRIESFREHRRHFAIEEVTRARDDEPDSASTDTADDTPEDGDPRAADQ